MENRYERILDAAQDAIERRNRARREIEYMLNTDEAKPEEQPAPDPASKDRPPERSRRLPF